MCKNHRILMILMLTIGSIFGCKEKSAVSVKNTTDLMKYGIPYAIHAPKDVTITKIGSGSLADVSVKNQNGYDVQVLSLIHI